MIDAGVADWSMPTLVCNIPSATTETVTVWRQTLASDPHFNEVLRER